MVSVHLQRKAVISKMALQPLDMGAVALVPELFQQVAQHIIATHLADQQVETFVLSQKGGIVFLMLLQLSGQRQQGRPLCRRTVSGGKARQHPFEGFTGLQQILQTAGLTLLRVPGLRQRLGDKHPGAGADIDPAGHLQRNQRFTHG